jgi:hypothetical protein
VLLPGQGNLVGLFLGWLRERAKTPGEVMAFAIGGHEAARLAV